MKTLDEWKDWTREHCPPDFAAWITKRGDVYVCPEHRNPDEKSREELEADRAEMRGWSNLELARHWAEAAWSAGDLRDWAIHYPPDRDEYVRFMAFNEACLEEFERRDLETIPLQ